MPSLNLHIQSSEISTGTFSEVLWPVFFLNSCCVLEVCLCFLCLWTIFPPWATGRMDKYPIYHGNVQQGDRNLPIFLTVTNNHSIPEGWNSSRRVRYDLEKPHHGFRKKVEVRESKKVKIHYLANLIVTGLSAKFGAFGEGTHILTLSFMLPAWWRFCLVWFPSLKSSFLCLEFSLCPLKGAKWAEVQEIVQSGRHLPYIWLTWVQFLIPYILWYLLPSCQSWKEWSLSIEQEYALSTDDCGLKSKSNQVN